MASIIAALDQLRMRIGDRVLIMLPDGPDFVDLVTCVTRLGGVPLPVNPQLSACDIVRVAAAARACLVLIPVDRLPALAELSTEPPVFVEGLQAPWAVGLRLSSRP
jgi:acyl-coenzyme A synthetase/AMP-(fatty) acid ligase